MHRRDEGGRPRRAAGRLRASAEALGPIGSLRRAAREYSWLYDSRRGSTAREIAAREGVSVTTVELGIRRARLAEPAAVEPPDAAARAAEARAVPLFPVGLLTPTTPCPHRGEVMPPFVCMVCHNRRAGACA